MARNDRELHSRRGSQSEVDTRHLTRREIFSWPRQFPGYGGRGQKRRVALAKVNFAGLINVAVAGSRHWGEIKIARDEI
jgi:hypothetical protein